jgi:hypothetical protein
VTLVRSGARPSVLAGPAALLREARPALEAWQPVAPHHALALGLQLARELAGQTGTVMVMSDLEPGARGAPGPGDALWVAAGEPLDNVGITSAERSLSPEEGRGAIALTLGNYSAAPVRRRLSVSAGDKEVLARELDIPPGVSSLTLPLPAGLPAVRALLEGDALPRDNEVTLAEPRPRVVGVENRLAPGRGREALDRALAALGNVTTAEGAHLAFAEASSLDAGASPGVWRVGFGQPPAAWRAPGEPNDFIGPFVLEKRHALLLGVTLGGVVWSGASPLVGRALRPLVSAGDQALVGIRAMGASRNAEPAILFNLDLDRTNLIRTPDWPILVSNLVEMRRQSLPGPERWNYRVGEWVRVRLGRDPTGPLRIRSPGVDRSLPPGAELEFAAPSPGGLLQILEGETLLFELGVNFLDEAESDVRRQSTADAGQPASREGLRAESGPSSDPLFWLLLTVGGTAIVLNWCLLPAPRKRA